MEVVTWASIDTSVQFHFAQGLEAHLTVSPLMLSSCVFMGWHCLSNSKGWSTLQKSSAMRES